MANLGADSFEEVGDDWEPKGAEQLLPASATPAPHAREAVINALVAAETMTGVNGHTVVALPHDRLREVLQKYNRLLQ